MTNRTAQHEMHGEEFITIPTPQAAAESLRRRGDGGITNWLRNVIERWHRSFSTQQGVEFRTDESVLEQHFLASLPDDNWRVPYGIDSPQARDLVDEITWRRKHGQSLDGLVWPPSGDPYAPANNPNHPYYLLKEAEA